MYVHYITRLCDCFVAFYVAESDHTGAPPVWLVLVWIGPSCPHAHSRLILLLPSAGWTVWRCLTLFPQMQFGLAAPVWVLGVGFSIPHMHTCCYKVNYHIHSWIGGTHAHILNHIDHITGEDQTNFLLPTPSVWNSNIIESSSQALWTDFIKGLLRMTTNCIQ
jgi:hypothetical protein